MKNNKYKLRLALIITLTNLLISTSINAQSPEKMSYQAVIRNSSDALVSNTQISMQISILQGSAGGALVYSETQTPTTNANGLISIEIGGGAGFSTIDWANGPYFIKTETDPTGGASYTIAGTSQLLSVPYALYAKSAESITGTIIESDPVYSASEAINIDASDITNLDDLSGTNTGDQDLSQLATKTALGDSTAHVRNDIPDVSGFLSSESDPEFAVSLAKGITASDTSYWNNKLDAEIDASISNEIQALSIGNDTIYLENGGFVKLPAASSQNTLNQAYDEGGNGAGRTITADAGAFKVAGTDGVVFTGAYDSGTIPATGYGTRMMWYPKKAAFRAGRVIGTEWDNNNIGEYSMAMGYNTTASGDYSTAMGRSTTASGYYSTAMGWSTTASGRISTVMGYSTEAIGDYSTAMGYYTEAIGDYSTAMGRYSSASGDYSTAMGLSTTASGGGSTAMGRSTTASGDYSTAMGFYTTASGGGSTAMGYGTTASGNNSTVVGRYNAEDSDALFIVGNGSNLSAKKNAFVVETDGDVKVDDDLYIGTSSDSDDDYIYIDGGSEYILWDDSETGFVFSDDILVGTNTADDNDYIYFDNEKDEYLRWRGAGGYDYFQFSDDLKVSNDLIANDLWTLFDGGGTEYRLVPSAGFVKYSIGSFYSDRRLKENIKTIATPLQKIQKLRGVTYNWNSVAKDHFIEKHKKNVRPDRTLSEVERENKMQEIVDEKLAELSKPEMSFIAQEVEAIFPEWVIENEDGYKEITMKGLDGVLVEAIKELKTEKDKDIQDLKTENNKLHLIIADLVGRIEKLEKK